MFLFKVILIFFISISPLKADTIYNLIKIPNLEIYEINTKNGLRYLNATRPFRLGLNVEKNNNCFNSDKKTLDKKYKIVKKNLNKYSLSFLKKINLKYIVLCKNLSIAGINTAGIPNNITRTLILDIEFNKKHFQRAIHHEVFHIINDSHEEIFNKNKWLKFNNKNFKYTKCSTCSENLGLNMYKNTNGFFSEYSKSTASEDMAETYSFMMTLNPEKLNEITKLDYILAAKVKFIRIRLLEIYKKFRFPGAMSVNGNF